MSKNKYKIINGKIYEEVSVFEIPRSLLNKKASVPKKRNEEQECEWRLRSDFQLSISLLLDQFLEFLRKNGIEINSMEKRIWELRFSGEANLKEVAEEFDLTLDQVKKISAKLFRKAKPFRNEFFPKE